MSVFSNKKTNLTNTLIAFKSICDNPNIRRRPKSKFEELNIETNNILGFLLLLINILLGSNKLREIIGGILKQVLPAFVQAYKDLLSKEFNKISKKGKYLSEIACLNGDGIIIPISYIDVLKNLKYSPNEKDSGYILILREALNNPDSAINLSDSLYVIFNSNNDTLTIKRRIDSVDKKVYTLFLDEFLNVFDLSINTLIEKILNRIFNYKSKEKSLDDLKLENEQEKLIDEFLAKDSIEIQLTNFDFDQINADAILRSNGQLTMDFTCSVVGFGVNQDIYDTILNTQYDELTDQEIGDLMNDMLQESVNFDQSDSNIEDFYNKTFINKIMNILLKDTIFGVDFLLTTGIILGINNNCQIVPTQNYRDVMRIHLELLRCLAKELKDKIYQYLYDIIEKEVKRLIVCMVKEVKLEQARNYIKIIKSLI